MEKYGTLVYGIFYAERVWENGWSRRITLIFPPISPEIDHKSLPREGSALSIPRGKEHLHLPRQRDAQKNPNKQAWLFPPVYCDHLIFCNLSYSFRTFNSKNIQVCFFWTSFACEGCHHINTSTFVFFSSVSLSLSVSFLDPTRDCRKVKENFFLPCCICKAAFLWNQWLFV